MKKITKKEPKFCTECGRKLKKDTCDDGYDTFTGRKKEVLFLVCPTIKNYGYLGDGVTISESGTHDIIFKGIIK